MSEQIITIPPGVIAMTTFGIIQGPTAFSMWEARSYAEAQGLKNIKYLGISGALVEKARNDACRQMLGIAEMQWLLMIDADMNLPKECLVKILQTAYGTHPWADVVGGYANLRGDVAIPTIDTGTGTWESIYPNSGVIEVMRTGGAFLLVKRHVCERIPQPWFATRVPMRPLDALYEMDNYARIKFDGSNPLREHPAWAILETMASQDPSAVKQNFVPAEVGEDSGFCDRVKAHGMRIVVDTSIVIGHLHQVTLTGDDHRKAMKQRELDQRYSVGLLQ